MSKTFRVRELIDNFADELKRAQDMMQMMSEGKEIPSDRYEKLQNDIHSDLDRFRVYEKEIKESIKNTVIIEEKTPIFEFINDKFFREDEIVPIATLHAKSSSVESNSVNLSCNNKTNEFELCYCRCNKNKRPRVVFKKAILPREDVEGKSIKKYYGMLADFFNKNADVEIPVDIDDFCEDGGLFIDYTDKSTIEYHIKRLKDECERYLSEGLDKYILSEGNAVDQLAMMRTIYDYCDKGYFITQNTINRLADQMECQAVEEYKLYKEGWMKEHIDEQTMDETFASYKQSGLSEKMYFGEYYEKYGFANGSRCMSFNEFKANKMADKKTITYSGYLGSFEYDPTVFDICVIRQKEKDYDLEKLIYMGAESNKDEIDLPNGFDRTRRRSAVLTMSELEEHIKQLDNRGLGRFIDKNPQKRELVNRLTEFDYDTYVSERRVLKPKMLEKQHEEQRDRLMSLWRGYEEARDMAEDWRY